MQTIKFTADEMDPAGGRMDTWVKVKYKVFSQIFHPGFTYLCQGFKKIKCSFAILKFRFMA